jgi:hypothetical protein
MSNPDVSSSAGSDRYTLSAVIRASRFRLRAMGMAVTALVGSFAWAAGWLLPGRLDQNRMIGTFERVNGLHPGFRRNHAKGVCLASPMSRAAQLDGNCHV